MTTILYYLLVINIITFIVYGIDKKRARHHHHNARRVPEDVLMGLAVIGGSLGARLAMSFYNHKTQKTKFTVGVTLLLFLHIFLLGAAWTFAERIGL